MRPPVLIMLFVLFVLVGLVLSGCGKPEADLPVVRVGHAPHDHHSPLYVAAMNPEYFKAHGGVYLREIAFRKDYELISGERAIARVLIDSSTGGRELIRKLSEDQFDISFGGVPAMLEFIDEGRPIHILAPIMAEGAGLIVEKSLPVSTWPEFLDYVRRREKPLRIGYKIATSVQNLIFEQALMASAISFSSSPNDDSVRINLINLHGAKNLIPAMENGLVDGFVVMQPFLALAQTRESGKLIALLRDLPPEQKWRGHPCCALAANDAFVQSHGLVAETMTSLMLRANRFIIEHPEQSARQIAHWLGLPAEVEEESLPTIKFTAELDEAWDNGVQFWIESMIADGMLKGKVKDVYPTGDVSELIYDKDTYDRAKGQMQ